MAHHRIPAPDGDPTARRPFTDARRRGSGTRVRQIAGPANDAHATEIDVYPDVDVAPVDLEGFDEVDERSTPTGGKLPVAPVAPVAHEADEAAEARNDSLEARLIYETRAIGERRRALAGREWDKATRRVDVRDADRTLMGLQSPPPPPAELVDETPPAAASATDPLPVAAPPVAVVPVVTTAVVDDDGRIARFRLRRGIVRTLGVLLFTALVVGVGLLLRAHDPGLVHTRDALVAFVQTLLR